MRARATTTVSILRGEKTDDYGDTVATDIPVKAGVVAAIIEQNRRVYLPTENRISTVRAVSARLPATTDVRTNDRLRDERTGAVYLVTEIHRVTAPTHTPDLAVELSYTD